MGLPSILTIMFILLRAFEVITWSWWIVFSPLIISLLFWVTLFFIAVITEKKY